MNRERRKMINVEVANLDDAKADLQTALDEEQDYFDNMPEDIQASDKGDTAREAIEIVDTLEDVIGEAGELS